MKHLHLIINPNAGLRQARRMLPDITGAFSRAGYDTCVFQTEKRGDATSYVLENAPRADLLVACGGDGTLNEVITGLLAGGFDTPLGYLPAGSTNDFANCLGIPLDLHRACEAVVSRSPHPLDMGRFGDSRYFTYSASFGAFTSVSWATPQNIKNVLGRAAYFLQGIVSLSEIRPIHLKVTADREEYENDYIFGAVCNSTSLGGVLKLDSMQVDMNDGLFEALLIPYPPDLLVLNRIIAALSSHNYHDPSLIFVRASSFLFEGAPDIHWSLDGEEAPGAPSVCIRNLHSAVRLIC